MYDQNLTMKIIEISYIERIPLFSQLGNSVAWAIGKGTYDCNFNLDTHLYLDKKEDDF